MTKIFNFNEKKEIGVKKHRIGDRMLIEAVVKKWGFWKKDM